MNGDPNDIFMTAVKTAQDNAPAPSDPNYIKSIPPDLLVAVMKMQKKIHDLAQGGERVSSWEIDDYLRKKTGGKYGLDDYRKLQDSPGNGVRSILYGLAANQLDNILGFFDKTAGDESRVRQEAYSERHPVRSALGGLLGAVAAGAGIEGPVEGILGEAKTIPQVMKMGAVTGGLYGGLDAAGRADDESGLGKLEEGVKGAAIGATAGAAISGVTAGIVRALHPDDNAINRIATAIAKDGGKHALKDRLREMVEAGRGAEVTVADLGPHLAKALDFAANESENVFVPTADLLKARTAERAARILADVRANSGAPARLIGESPNLSPAEVRAGEGDFGLRQGQLEANTSAVGNKVFGDLAAANPTFDTSTLPLDNPKIGRLYEQARLAGNLQGGGPLDELITKLTQANPGVPSQVIKQAAQEIAGAAGKGAGERPVSLSDLMQLRQALEGQTSAAFKSGNGSLGTAMKGIKDEVSNALEAGAPGYSDANAAYKGANDLERALQSGHDWWLKADQRELARTVDGLKSQPGALDEFRRGIASGLIEKLQATATNRDAARELLQKSGDLDAKLKIIFGDTRTFQSFMKRVAAERKLGELAQTIGGSATSRRIAARGINPADLGIDVATRGPGALTRAAGAAARAATLKRTADAMGPKLLTQGAPNIEAFLRTIGDHAGTIIRPSTIAMPTYGLLNLIPNLFANGQ